MKVTLFAASAGNWVMIEIAQMFADGFRANGVEAELLLDQEPAADSAARDLQIVVAPHEFYPLFLEGRVGRKTAARLNRGVYLLTVEKPGTSWFDMAFAWAAGARGVLDINVGAVREMRARGVGAIHAPLGYTPCLESVSAANGRKTIDLLFMGAYSPRREQFLAENGAFFSRYRCQLLLARIDKPRLATTPGFVSGNERNDMLRASRILLNVRLIDNSRYLEWHRVLAAVANHCLVVSEQSDDLEPLVAGRHMVIADLGEMPLICEEYLRSPERLATMADEAYRFVAQELTMARSCEAVLASVGAAG